MDSKTPCKRAKIDSAQQREVGKEIFGIKYRRVLLNIYSRGFGSREQVVYPQATHGGVGVDKQWKDRSGDPKSVTASTQFASLAVDNETVPERIKRSMKKVENGKGSPNAIAPTMLFFVGHATLDSKIQPGLKAPAFPPRKLAMRSLHTHTFCVAFPIERAWTTSLPRPKMCRNLEFEGAANLADRICSSRKIERHRFAGWWWWGTNGDKDKAFLLNLRVFTERLAGAPSLCLLVQTIAKPSVCVCLVGEAKREHPQQSFAARSLTHSQTTKLPRESRLCVWQTASSAAGFFFFFPSCTSVHPFLLAVYSIAVVPCFIRQRSVAPPTPSPSVPSEQGRASKEGSKGALNPFIQSNPRGKNDLILILQFDSNVRVRNTHNASQSTALLKTMTNLSSSPTTTNATLSPWTKDHTYIIESTRRAHACCKSCEAKIELGRLRVGVVFQHMNGFVCINWHHIECYPDVKQIPLHNLEGFGDLDASHQKLVQSYMLAGVETRYLPEARACSA